MAIHSVIVIATGRYMFGQGLIDLGVSGLVGQVTKFSINGSILYTRETVGAVDSFIVGSGERWGDKSGKRPSKSRQALELIAPADQWQHIATMVRQIDPYRRRVIANKRFTVQWAEQTLRDQYLRNF